MTLEVLRNGFRTIKISFIEAIVFLFAMMCSKIFTRSFLFKDSNTKIKILLRIKVDRLVLPSQSGEIIKLIQECWNLNPTLCLNFANIWRRLIIIK